MVALDTNVRLYHFDESAPQKREVAVRLFDSVEEAVILWQVGVDFLAVGRRLSLSDPTWLFNVSIACWRTFALYYPRAGRSGVPASTRYNVEFSSLTH